MEPARVPVQVKVLKKVEAVAPSPPKEEGKAEKKDSENPAADLLYGRPDKGEEFDIDRFFAEDSLRPREDLGTAGLPKQPPLDPGTGSKPSPKLAPPTISPAKKRQVRVLYLFAGKERKSDVGQWLLKLAKEYDAEVLLEQIDILRDPDHDITKPGAWAKIKLNISSGQVDVFICTPPCHTHSRVRWANNRGPAPCRSKLWPQGFPWLRGKSKDECDQANFFVDITEEGCRLAALRNSFYLVEHPEDLGRTSTGGDPASIWGLDKILSLAKDSSAQSYSLFQCHFQAPSSKPTRLLTNLKMEDKRLFPGWPKFGPGNFYKGPLPPRCGCAKRHMQLVGRSSAGGFRTAASAAYPSDMCKMIAKAILKSTVTDHRLKSGQISSVCATPKRKITCLEDLDLHFEQFDQSKRLKPNLDKTEEPEEPEEATSSEDEDGEKRITLEEATRGWGKPMCTWWSGKQKDFHDGCGLVSRGRYHPDVRAPVAWGGVSLLDKALEEVIRSRHPDYEKKVLELALGRHQSSPWSEASVAEVRKKWAIILSSESELPESKLLEVPFGQPFLLYAIGETLRLASDPDHRIFFRAKDSFVSGVPVGRGKMPRVPAIYERKVKWRKYDPSDFSWQVANYKSADQLGARLEDFFEQEAKEDLMVRMKLSDAKKEWKDLRVAAQGAVLKDPEGTSFRIVHDATHGVQVNPEIRMRDQARMPTAAEAKSLMELQSRERPGAHFQMLMDVAKAHRRVKHRREDWGLLGCQSVNRKAEVSTLRKDASESPRKVVLTSPEEHVWLNCVGTFGVSSAAYWWSRLSSAVGRITMMLLGNTWTFLLLYADDIRVSAHGPQKFLQLAKVMLFWEAAGCPISWKKRRGGLEVEWLGYYLDYRGYCLGISIARRDWLLKWASDILSSGMVLVHNLAEGVGRLSYSTGVLEWGKPFLAPLYALTAALPRGATISIPPLVRLVLSWICHELKHGQHMVSCKSFAERKGELFRTDASGNENFVVLGGWETSSTQDPKKARWFSLKLSKEEVPWLFARGHASRTISAGEMLATLCAVHLFTTPGEPARGLVAMRGLTDNSGNMHIARKLYTSSFPTAAVLMQLTTTLARRSLWLDLAWIPREENKLADELTNEEFQNFDPGLRQTISLKDLDLSVLDKLLEVTDSFEKARLEQKELKAQQQKKEALASGKGKSFKGKKKEKSKWG